MGWHERAEGTLQETVPALILKAEQRRKLSFATSFNMLGEIDQNYSEMWSHEPESYRVRYTE